MLKVNNEDTGVFLVNFEHISHLVLVFLLLTLHMQLPAGINTFMDMFKNIRHVCEHFKICKIKFFLYIMYMSCFDKNVKKIRRRWNLRNRRLEEVPVRKKQFLLKNG